MGIDIKKEGQFTTIEGRGLKGLQRPNGPIDVGESGTSMRLLAGILAGQDFEAILTGDESLSRRPMKRIVEPLSIMGVDIRAKDGEYPPITIRGGSIKPIDYKMPIDSAQVKSAILLAGLYAKGTTKVEELFKSRDHTERMLRYFGADVAVKGNGVSVKGIAELAAKDFDIPADISSASFFMAGATLLTGSKIRIAQVGINPTRAKVLEILARMGAKVKVKNAKELFEPAGDIEIESSLTKGIVIEKNVIPGIIDELPIIFVLASLSKGRTIIKGAGELRFKETDRINSMSQNLSAMGAKISLDGDDVIIDGVDRLNGAQLKSFGDHRTCMAMTIAALAAESESAMDDIECANKSFPEFFNVLNGLKR
jgi:3-phosphoshikimate 1-carboxyvinyltransferase